MGFFEEMKAQVSLKDLVESRTELKAIGKGRYKGFSPWNSEKTPSFYVDEENKVWKDFSTKKGGGILDWFVEAEGMTKQEAVHYIAESYGIELEDKKVDKNTDLRYCLKMAHAFYRRGRDKAVEYLESRGYPSELVDKYEMGYAPDSLFEIINYLTSKNIDKKTIVESGVGMWDNQNSSKVLARQRNRIMIPVKDKYGALIGFIGRAAVPSVKPKYLNPTNSPLFSRDTTLFNFEKVRGLIKDKGLVVVSEGPFDAIMGSHAGIPTVSVLGSSVSEEQLGVLSKVTQDIYLAFDSDDAGRAAMLETFKKLEESNTDVLTHALQLPEGKDVADYVEEHGAEGLNSLIYAAIPDTMYVVQALYDTAMKTSTKPSAVARKVLEQVKPYFSKDKYSYRNLDLLDRLSQILNLDKSRLDSWIKSDTEFKHNSQVYKKIEAIEFPGAIYERRIMTECLRDPTNIKVLKTMGITRYDFESQLVSNVLSLVDGQSDPFSVLQDNLNQEDYDTVLSAYMNAEQVTLDIYSLGGIIVANKSKVRGAVSSVNNIIGRRKNYLEREVSPTYQELLRRLKE